MDLAFAAESLKPIPKDHILARKASDLDGLRQMAATNHLELVKLVLNSYGGKATVDQIQHVLVPDVIRDDWKKWWEAAKRELKKDGHFQVPLKKTEPIIYQAKEVSLAGPADGGIPRGQGFEGPHRRRRRSCSRTRTISRTRQAAATEVIAALNAEIASYQRTQPAVALEAIFARDDMREAMAELPPAPERGSGPGHLGAGREARPAAGSSCRRPSIAARWSPSRPPIPSAGTNVLRRP